MSCPSLVTKGPPDPRGHAHIWSKRCDVIDPKEARVLLILSKKLKQILHLFHLKIVNICRRINALYSSKL